MATASRQRSQNKAPLGDKAYRLITVDDMTGGVDLRRSPSLVQPSRARYLRNVSLEEPGAWRPYPGWETFSTTSLGAGRVQGARRVYLANTTFTLASFAGSVYRPTDAGVWGAATLTGRSASAQHHFVYDRNLCALFDSQATPQKTVDGSTWEQFGITAPTVALTPANLAGGSLVSGNQIELSYTYGDTALSFESNGAPVATHTPAAGNLSIRCTIPRSTDPQVDTIYVYARDVTAGQSVKRRAGSVANPAAGNATFDLTSNTWFPDGLEIPTRHNLPGVMSYGVVWRNRWWGLSATVGNRIHFTEVFLPQAWPSLYYVDIPFEKGDRITGLIALGDTLVVFGNTGVFLIIGQTSLDFEVRPSAGAVAGSLGVRACAVIEQGIVHAAEGGVYIFDGASDRLLSDDIASGGWRDMMENATPGDIELIALTYHDRRKEIRVSVPRMPETAAAGEWVLDLSRTRLQEVEAWTATDRAIGGYLPWDGKEAAAGDQGRLLSWKVATGELSEEAVGTSADGADMTCIYEGPALLAAPRRWTRFIDLFGEYSPASGTFGIEVKVDDVPATLLTIGIGATLTLYGSGVYGTSLYGGRLRRNFTSMLPLTAEGLTITLRATYTGQATFRWFTYAIGHRPEPMLRGFN